MLIINNLNISDPYFNLALEEYAVRNFDTSEHSYILFYINEPTVVLGKNQNVFEEANLSYCAEQGIKIARRVSGGGTVFHDWGNLNISIISKFNDRNIGNYDHLFAMIIEYFLSIGIDLNISERNDLLYKNFKVSGSAQFTDRKNILSHCTLLLNSKLNTLSRSLSIKKYTIESKALKSKRSKVFNLSDAISTSIFSLGIKNALTNKILKNDQNEIFSLSKEQLTDCILLMKDKYKVWSWIFAKSPKCKIQIGQTTLFIEKGIIIKIDAAEEIIGNLNENIINKPLNFSIIDAIPS